MIQRSGRTEGHRSQLLSRATAGLLQAAPAERASGRSLDADAADTADEADAADGADAAEGADDADEADAADGADAADEADEGLTEAARGAA